MPPTRRATALLSILAYSFSFAVFGLQVNLLGPSLSVVAQRVGRPEADLGIIFTLSALRRRLAPAARQACRQQHQQREGEASARPTH
jgi:hypothetical protein